MRTIAIIACGNEKAEGFHAAADLYKGQLFSSNLQAALAVTSIDNVYILSAKYGFVPALQAIDSYNVKLGDAGCVTVAELVAQAESLGLEATDAYVFAPKAYWEAIHAVGEALYWAPQWVNEADPGIGYQRGTARVVRQTAA